MKDLFQSSQIQDCFFGDGDLVNSFQVSYPLFVLSELTIDFNNLNSIKNLFAEDSNNRQVDYWLAEVNKYVTYQKQGVSLSSANGFQFYDLPDNSLDKMNSWSNIDYVQNDLQNSEQYRKSCGPVTRDQFAYRTSDCVGYNIPLLYNELIGAQCCIPLDQPNLYNQTFIQNRLDAINVVCLSDLTTITDRYMAYFNSLHTYTTKLNSILTSLQNDLANYKATNKLYLDDMVNLYNHILSSYKPSLQPLLEAVNDPAAGMLGNMNCSFLREEVKSIENGVCQSYMVRMYNLSSLIIADCVFSSLAMICYYFHTKRAVFYIESKKIKYLNKSGSRGHQSTEKLVEIQNRSPTNPRQIRELDESYAHDESSMLKNAMDVTAI